MRRAIALALILALAGCSTTTGTPTTPSSTASPTARPSQTPEPDLAAPGTRWQALTWDGKQRTYLVHAPPDYRAGEKLPLVLALHFFPGTGEKMRFMTSFDAKADQERFLVVYPDGLSGRFNALMCCGDEDDVGFLSALIGHMRQFWGADPGRVYATGISNGADMSYKLAIELPGVLAAIAPVSGGYGGERVIADKTYVPRQPVPVITFIGGQDIAHNRFEQGLTWWKQRLGCTDGPASTVRDEITVTRARCDDGSEVVAYRLAKMAHSWPGGAKGGTMSDTFAGISATDLIWSFFEAHPRGRPTA